MIKLITINKPEKSVFNLDELAKRKSQEERDKIVLDVIDFLVRKNGVAYLKYERKNRNIIFANEILKKLRLEIDKYRLKNQDVKVTIVGELPKNKKQKNENIYEPFEKQDSYNLIPLYLALIGDEFEFNGSEKYNFYYTDGKKEDKEPIIVRIKADDENSKNAGQVASYVLRSIVKDDNETTISYIPEGKTKKVELKAYQTLMILGRMSQESIESICGGYFEVPKAYQRNKIKIFMEMPEETKEKMSTYQKDNENNVTQTENENVVKSVVKIKFHLALVK